ncbi:MAG: DUF2157 domain-containing protein [Candidatus Doudnabacteria bacterium]|nr:DUF2157 domain-containing protein [Candidatus Doudnabacteria bacterium]
MDSQSLQAYIAQAESAGKTREVIYTELLGSGHSLTDIEAAYKAIKEVHDGVDTQKRTVLIILTIAAVLVAAGVFSFVASNWQEMGKPLKIVILVAATLGMHLGGWFAAEKKQYPKLGSSLFLLGTLLFGASVFLVGQIFNASAQWPDGFILWMFGALLMGAARKSSAQYAIAIVVGIIAVITHPIQWFDLPGGFNPIITTSGLLLLLAAVVTGIAGVLVRRRMPTQQDTDIY